MGAVALRRAHGRMNDFVRSRSAASPARAPSTRVEGGALLRRQRRPACGLPCGGACDDEARARRRPARGTASARAARCGPERGPQQHELAVAADDEVAHLRGRCRRPSGARARARAGPWRAARRNRRSTGSGRRGSAGRRRCARARCSSAGSRQDSRRAGPRTRATPAGRGASSEGSGDAGAWATARPHRRSHSAGGRGAPSPLRGHRAGGRGGAPTRKRRSVSESAPPTAMTTAPSQISRMSGL